MYLSRLQVFGFKSFPQKLDMTFNAGVCAVVGPNGCGKTNLVDAIRWALGEQRPSVLRGDRMEEVIFSGTQQRKPLGMAEVSLTIENAENILPSEYSQVVITRRLYRSGESEYLLNRTPCRLKDIIDLFLDTGMGAHAYAVMSREMIDSLLDDRADDRKRLFEEAAGVMKYRSRRQETQRKLKATRNDLVRIEDLIAEVEREVRSLRRQGRMAERYQERQRRLQEVEVILGSEEYGHLMARLRNLECQLADYRKLRGQVDVQSSQQEAQAQQVAHRLAENEPNLSQVREKIAGLLETIHTIEGEITLKQERLRAAQQLIDRSEEELKGLAARRDQVVARGEKAQEEMETISSTLAAKENMREELDRDLARRDEDVFRAKVRLDEGRKDLVEISRKIREMEAARDGLRFKQRSLTERRQSIDAEISEIVSRLEDVVKEGEDIREKLGELRRNGAELDKRRKDFVAQIEMVIQRRELLLRSQRESESCLAGVEAKLEFLRGVLESRDGYGSGVRALVDEGLPGLLGTVADLIEVDERYARAIEGALGESAQYLVAETETLAEKALVHLRSRNLGRATFISLDRVAPLPLPEPGRQVEGAIGWAGDFVRCDAKYEKVAHLLLDGFLIAEDLKFARENGCEGINLVTLEGEVVGVRGTLTGGSARDGDHLLVGRRDRLVRLEEERSAHKEKLAGFDKDLERLSAQQDVESRRLSEMDRHLAQREEGARSLARRGDRLNFEQDELKKRHASFMQELEQIDGELKRLDVDLDCRDEELARLSRDESRLREEAAKREEEQEQKDKQGRELAQRVNQTRVEVVSLQGREEQLRRELVRSTELKEEILSTMERRRKEREEAQRTVTGISEELERLTAHLIRETSHRKANQEILDHLLGEQRDLKEKLGVLEEELRESRERGHGLQSKIHQVELQTAELNVAAQGLKDRMLLEHGIQLTSEHSTSLQSEERERLRDEVSALREKIRCMGPVNLIALREYQSQKKRLDFLVQQRDDLREAEASLQKAMDRIDRTARMRFLRNFRQIRENFQQVFLDLFEGGEADLRLTWGEDPLDAQVEIIARPRGKRFASLTHLSGGERALTAISLLFAIYLLKPSPFCILDEVDAPLDDANIGRFLRLIRRFSQSSQFIVITHNKQTMEMADVLFGVTMEEPGVSKLVSVKLDGHVSGGEGG